MLPKVTPPPRTAVQLVLLLSLQIVHMMFFKSAADRFVALYTVDNFDDNAISREFV